MEDMMKASVVDLRYKMNEVLKALDRREKVILSYHGRVKGTIVPVESDQMRSVVEHPFFNMAGDQSKTVRQQMDALRGPRFNDV
jgi:antitoxin (DNA-binding transcriptional repressor) of toxin-antitoxin stability system